MPSGTAGGKDGGGGDGEDDGGGGEGEVDGGGGEGGGGGRGVTDAYATLCVRFTSPVGNPAPTGADATRASADWPTKRPNSGVHWRAPRRTQRPLASV